MTLCALRTLTRFLRGKRIISLVCFSSETLNSCFFFMSARQKGSWSQAYLTETVDTGDKNSGVTKAMHRKKSCERCRAFPERVSPRILSLESDDYFGTSDYFSGAKKEKS